MCTVSAFYSENDALSAISDKSKGFHVAIVEVFKFFEFDVLFDDMYIDGAKFSKINIFQVLQSGTF